MQSGKDLPVNLKYYIQIFTHYFQDDEFVIYDPRQQRIRYLVEFSLPIDGAEVERADRNQKNIPNVNNMGFQQNVIQRLNATSKIFENDHDENDLMKLTLGDDIISRLC